MVQWTDSNINWQALSAKEIRGLINTWGDNGTAKVARKTAKAAVKKAVAKKFKGYETLINERRCEVGVTLKNGIVLTYDYCEDDEETGNFTFELDEVDNLTDVNVDDLFAALAKLKPKKKTGE